VSNVPVPIASVVPGSLYEDVELEGSDDRWDAEGCRFIDCRFAGATVAAGRAERAAWRGGVLDGVRLVGVSMPRSNWLDLRVERCALSGCELYGAQWRRVKLMGCRLDSVNLREATLREVEFVDCTVKHLDVGSARLTDVTLRDCVVEQLDVSNATLSRVDLRGSRLDLARGFDRLRGVTIDHTQLLDLAPALAAHLGLTVRAGGAGDRG
jgi:uncharacterized protein YjbI with pentapeptide repeats